MMRQPDVLAWPPEDGAPEANLLVLEAAFYDMIFICKVESRPFLCWLLSSEL